MHVYACDEGTCSTVLRMPKAGLTQSLSTSRHCALPRQGPQSGRSSLLTTQAPAAGCTGTRRLLQEQPPVRVGSPPGVRSPPCCPCPLSTALTRAGWLADGSPRVTLLPSRCCEVPPAAHAKQFPEAPHRRRSGYHTRCRQRRGRETSRHRAASESGRRARRR